MSTWRKAAKVATSTKGIFSRGVMQQLSRACKRRGNRGSKRNARVRNAWRKHLRAMLYQ